MGKGSSGSKTTYTQSPEQAQVYQALLPLLQGLSQQGAWQMGQSNLGAPAAPTAPSMSGVLSGISTSQLMPSKSWYDSMSPEVKAGVWAPYQEGASKLQEQLGSIGGLGNQRGGVSGSGAAGLGQYWADASPQAALSMWNMSQPGMQAGYNAQLTEANTNYQNQLNQQTRDYETQRQAWQLPFGLTQQMPGTYSQGITTQPSSGVGGAFGGAMTGGLAGGMIGGPWGAGIGAGIGGLGGLFGGK
jgi:hypothetical protein